MPPFHDLMWIHSEPAKAGRIPNVRAAQVGWRRYGRDCLRVRSAVFHALSPPSLGARQCHWPPGGRNARIAANRHHRPPCGLEGCWISAHFSEWSDRASRSGFLSQITDARNCAHPLTELCVASRARAREAQAFRPAGARESSLRRCVLVAPAGSPAPVARDGVEATGRPERRRSFMAGVVRIRSPNRHHRPPCGLEGCWISAHFSEWSDRASRSGF